MLLLALLVHLRLCFCLLFFMSLLSCFVKSPAPCLVALAPCASLQQMSHVCVERCIHLSPMFHGMQYDLVHVRLQSFCVGSVVYRHSIHRVELQNILKQGRSASLWTSLSFMVAHCDASREWSWEERRGSEAGRKEGGLEMRGKRE